MEIHRENFNSNKNHKLIFTLGMFDGVHLGHQFILKHLDEIAKSKGGETAIMTFTPHPKFVFQPNTNFRLLTTLDEKIELLERFDIQHLFLQEFSKEFSQLSALEFVRDILVSQLHIDSLVIGYDHHFGKNRNGNFKELQTLSKEFNFSLHQLLPFSESEQVISSTKIRTKIDEGDIEEANKWLGYNFIMTGRVVEGDKIGRKIGFPTANMKIDEQKICPANGVYFVKVKVGGDYFYGMMNIGMRPTVSGIKKQIEVHILDFDQNIYGEQIEVYFYARERSEVRFSSLESLKKQLFLDREKAKQYFKNYKS